MTVLVVDASAAVDVLLGLDAGQALRSVMRASEPDLHTVAHLDAEVLSALGRLHRAGELGEEDVTSRLDALAELRLRRLPIKRPLLRQAWLLGDRIALRDGLYVAAAMALGGRVLTSDDRLRRAAPDHTTGPR